LFEELSQFGTHLQDFGSGVEIRSIANMEAIG